MLGCQIQCVKDDRYGTVPLQNDVLYNSQNHTAMHDAEAPPHGRLGQFVVVTVEQHKP